MRSESLLARLGVILTMGVGFLVLYITTLGFMTTLIVTRPIPADPSTYPTAVAMIDGQPRTTKGVWLGNWTKSQTLDGTFVELVDKQVVQTGAQLPVRDDTQAFSSALLTSSWNAMGFRVGSNLAEPWYLITERRGNRITAYFARYSNATLAAVGYIGAKGESATRPTLDDQFQLLPQFQILLTEEGYSLLSMRPQTMWMDYAQGGISLRGNLYVLTTGGIDRVDLKSRQVTRLVESTDLQSLGRLPDQTYEASSQRLSDSGEKCVLVARSSTTIFNIADNQVRSKSVIPEALRQKDLHVYPVQAGTIYYATSDLPSGPTYSPQKLYRCDDAGQILQTSDISQPPYVNQDRLGEQLAMGMLFPAPVATPIFAALQNAFLKLPISEWLQRYQLAVLLQLLWGVVATIIAWQLAPRFSGTPATAGWLTFVFVTGLPGCAGYLLHFRRKLRPVVKPAPLLGTEIFA